MADKLTPTEFKVSLGTLIVNAAKDPKTFVRTIFYGFPAIYSGYALYMAAYDPANAAIWAASPVLVTLVCMTLGGALGDYINGFNITSLLQRWVKEEATVTAVLDNPGVTIKDNIAYIDVVMAKAAGIVIINDANWNDCIPIRTIYNGETKDEAQAKYNTVTKTVHSMSQVPDPFADVFEPRMKNEILDGIIRAPSPLKALLALIPSNVDLKFEIIWSIDKIAEFKAGDQVAYNQFVKNMLDLAVDNAINTMSVDMQKTKAIGLFYRYYKVTAV